MTDVLSFSVSSIGGTCLVHLIVLVPGVWVVSGSKLRVMHSSTASHCGFGRPSPGLLSPLDVTHLFVLVDFSNWCSSFFAGLVFDSRRSSCSLESNNFVAVGAIACAHAHSSGCITLALSTPLLAQLPTPRTRVFPRRLGAWCGVMYVVPRSVCLPCGTLDCAPLLCGILLVPSRRARRLHALLVCKASFGASICCLFSACYSYRDAACTFFCVTTLWLRRS